MPRFDPKPGDQLVLDPTTYRVTPHPVVPTMAFGQEGRKAIVYQLRSNSHLFALKIFKPSFRDASLVDTCQALSHLTQPGLEVCERDCLTPSSAASLLRQYPEMEYAVLMPWIVGSTWFDILVNNTRIGEDACKQMAQSTAEVLADLETRGYAHCDVAGGNVIVNTTSGAVSFIDVEDMFGPSLPAPSAFPQGTDGYQHRASRVAEQGQWCAEGDRFSAAVLLAEILAWHDARIRKAADEETYFAPHELQDPSSSRYQLMRDTLAGMSSEVAACFECAWNSATLAECPSLSEWAQLLEFPIVSAWLPIEAPPPPAPYQPEFTQIEVGPVTQPVFEFVDFSSLVTPQAAGTPPQTPKFFRISKSPDDGAYVLQWLAMQGAEGYIVEASEDEGFTHATQVYQGPDTGWKDPEQPEGIRYYRLCAYNAAGNSAWSDTVATY
jgi:hypothetical protein